MIILGIESSCDETAASIITENDKNQPVILSNVVSSQEEVHKNGVSTPAIVVIGDVVKHSHKLKHLYEQVETENSLQIA